MTKAVSPTQFARRPGLPLSNIISWHKALLCGAVVACMPGTLSAQPSAAEAAEAFWACSRAADPASITFAELSASDLDSALAACHTANTADPGNAQTRGRLGRVYHVRKDHAQALMHYEFAAEAGLAFAQYNLGLMYAQGQGVPIDEARAVALIQSAAESGYAFAQTDLGQRYIYGTGVAADPARGVALLTEAAERGDPMAMGWLGYLYLAGTGVAVNPTEAVRWLELGAAAGDTDAGGRLGTLFLLGEHVPKDYTKAFLTLSRAAKGGNGTAMFNLGHMYANGLGIDDSSQEAGLWMLGSVVAGHERLLDVNFRPERTTVYGLHQFLSWTGDYKGLVDTKFTQATAGAIRRFAEKNDVESFLAKADAFRAESKAKRDESLQELGKALAGAVLKSQAKEVGELARLGPKSSDPERVVIDHPPAEHLSGAWRSFIDNIRVPNKQAEVDGHRVGGSAALNEVWVSIVAVEPSTGLIYYTKAGDSGRLFSVGVQHLSETGLPPEGDHSSLNPTFLADIPKSDMADDKEWERLKANLAYFFKGEHLNGLEPGDEAALSGVLSDEEIVIFAADPARQMFYYAVFNDGWKLYRAGADHIISRQSARLRDVGRTGVALGAIYCIATGSCTE